MAAGLACLSPATPVRAEPGGYQRLEGHGGPVKGVAFSEGGRRMLTASFDYSVGLWDAQTGGLIRWLEGHEAAVNAVAFLPGNRALSAGDDFDMILWDLGTGDILKRFEGHKGKLIAVEVGPGATLAASAGWDGTVGLWPLSGGGEPRFLAGHRANVNDAAFTPDGTKLYTASYDGTIRRWDVATGAEEAIVVSHGFGVNHLVLNAAAGWLAYGALDGAVRAIDLASGAQIADLTADRRPILALAADPSGRFLAVGDGEGYVMVVDTADWSIRRDFRAALSGPIWALAWEPSGGRLLAGGIADEAALWPIDADGDALFAGGPREFHKPPSEMTNGERQFVRKCSICHSLTPDGGRKAGPTLWRLFGRRAGSVPGYAYSDALGSSGIVWTEETVARLFEEGPDVFTPGSKMPVQRIAKAGDRDDLIDYLRQKSGRADRAGSEVGSKTQ
ncbi:c-type cytochrome [Limibaculum sp. FT325]|uniref:c-type cytochrome n=1 Tax=Thermohalobaculum sediminis TaxID=2939436 RepID=UPI0020BE987D|nr:c-type cytochrome [Limibaculum sediminis]MCL5775631.1 c-type cytochrome [Limibaculum sediminis]